MSIRNVIPERQAILDHAGDPLDAGLIHVYEPGTLTPITSYSDSGLVNANTNPIVLSGAGRASVWLGRDADLKTTDQNGALITFEENVNPASTDTTDTGGLVPNGSFELDADADLIPDGWTATPYAGATCEIDTTTQTDGLNSFKFVSVGANGGGELETTDFFAVNEVDDLRVDFDLLADDPTLLQVIVQVRWYDVSQVFISADNAYDQTTNPVTWTSENALSTPPAGSRFAKLRLIGIDAAAAVAGQVNFDRVSVYYPQAAVGVFDNITISGNDIIATNTNGDINITPDGTGNVELGKDTNVTGALNVSTTIDAVGDVTAPNFIGDLTGDVTGNADTADKALTAAVATDAEFVVPFLSAASSYVDVSNDAGFTYNPFDDRLTVPNITGDLIGNVNGNVIGDLTGDVTGNADTASEVIVGSTVDPSLRVILSETATGQQELLNDAGLTYNAATDVLTAVGGFVGNITGDVTGNADTATDATNIDMVTSVDATCFIAFVQQAVSTTQRLRYDAALKFDATTGIVEAVDFTASSDIANKENIRPLGDPLFMLQRIGAYHYHRTDTNEDHIGYIAQEVQRVLPNAVYGVEGELSVSTRQVLALVIGAVNQLAERVDHGIA
jgi:hypothetical protein